MRNYVCALRDLQGYIDALAENITRDELLEFLAWRKLTVGNSTLNTNACALKYYYEKVARQPEKIVHIPTPRKPKQLGELLTDREVRSLIDTTKNPGHRLVIALLFGFGLRSSEVGQLRYDDFDADRLTLTIRNAKGGKTRVLPYGRHLRVFLLDHYRNGEPTDYLFNSNNRKAGRVGISNRGVQHIVREARKRTGIRKEFCPHTLRHCFAVSYLNNGGNLIRLKELLGHAHISTTFRYLRYASPQLKDIPSPLAFLPGA